MSDASGRGGTPLEYKTRCVRCQGGTAARLARGFRTNGQTKCELSISNLCSRNILQTRATGNVHAIERGGESRPADASPRARRARVRCPCTMCASLKSASRAPGAGVEGDSTRSQKSTLDSPRGATPNYSLDLSRSYGMVRYRR